jgi:imidazolonepropionase-like amidohydrolase
MTRRTRSIVVHAAALAVVALVLGTAGTAARSSALYAVRNARIVTVSGAQIDRGTIVMRNGVIEDVGANVTPPADAVVIDGTGLTVYPGLIDMTNSTAIDTGETAAAGAAGGRGGGGGGGSGGRGGAATPTITWEDQERAKRTAILHPDFDAARHVRLDGAEMQRLAAAGITTVLAVPSAGTIRGQSALVNVMAAPDDPQIGNIGDYRGGLTVIKSPVALHVMFGSTGGAAGYPNSLLGYIAFVRQSFYDAQWQKDARAFAERHKDAPRPAFEPSLDAIIPALERKVPVAFDADQEREILRALAMAKEFNLDVIISGGAEAATVTDDLKAANAKVIYSLNFGGATAGGGAGGGGGRGGGGGGDTVRTIKARVNAPRGPAALDKAGVPFAFSTDGSNPQEFVRNAGRVVKEGNLSADAALRALTINAAKLAGVAERLGTIEKGKIANLVVTEGDLLDGGRVRHVFVDGRPVDTDVPAAPATGRGGRGGGR